MKTSDIAAYLFELATRHFIGDRGKIPQAEGDVVAVFHARIEHARNEAFEDAARLVEDRGTVYDASRLASLIRALKSESEEGS